MNSSDKKHMVWIVFITIFLGLLMIFFLKPDYHTDQTASIQTRLNQEVYTEDFGELFHEFEEPEDTDGRAYATKRSL